MPIAKVQMPDGRIAKFEVPEGTTEQQVMEFAQSQIQPIQSKAEQKPYDPTEDMSGYEKFMAGVGKGFVDIGRGVGQMAGLVDQKAIDQAKREDAALMKTGWGKAGNIAGNVAVAAPAAFIPGANTAVGASLIGGALGAAQPVSTGDSRLVNTGLGAAFGLAGQQIGSRAIPWAINKAKGAVASAAARKTANAARDATIASAREAGYVLPPSEVKPTGVSNLLERWAGKASVGQQASLSNQQVTNKLVRESLGLPKDTPITPEALEPIKKAAWSVYEQVKNLGTLNVDDAYAKSLSDIGMKFNSLSREFPELANSQIDDLIKGLSKKQISSEGAVELVKNLRYQAKVSLNPMNMNPAARSLGKAQSAAADAIEGLIERNIKLNQEIAPNAAITNLLKDFKNARVTLGKVGTIERSMVESTGDVSARKLAAELAKGKPLTGELRKAAQFAQAYPRFNQMNVNPVPGGSPLDAAVAIGTSAATGNPGWLALAAGRPAARNLALSKLLAGQPKYSAGMTANMLSRVPNSRLTPQALGLLGPSIYAAQE